MSAGVNVAVVVGVEVAVGVKVCDIVPTGEGAAKVVEVNVDVRVGDEMMEVDVGLGFGVDVEACG